MNTPLKNRRHERFAQNYVLHDFNGSKAARAAGYATRSAGASAQDLLKNGTVLARIQELCRADVELLEMSRAEALAELNQLASYNVQDFYDDDGLIIPIHELDRATAANVNEVEMQDNQVVKLKAGKDKRAALDMVMRKHNMYEGDLEAGRGVINVYLDEKDLKA